MSVQANAPPGNSGDRARGRRGRKAASESRAAEIRGRLLAWKQTPEPQRISLRALADQMATSHQLLSFYLRSWTKWQGKEYQRKANDIRARPEAENRDLTPGEEAQRLAYERASFRSMIGSMLDETLRQLQVAVKAGPLSRKQIGIVNVFARRGDPIAQDILEKHRQYMNGAPTKTGQKWVKVICH